MILWILLGVIVLGLGLLTIQYLTWKRGIKYEYTGYVDGKPLTLYVHYDHKLPREILKAQGFSLGHIWMAWPKEYVIREDIAGEVIHQVQEHFMGWFKYAAVNLFEWATQWVRLRRGLEEETHGQDEKLARYPASCELSIQGSFVEVKFPFLLQFRLEDDTL